MQATGTVEPTQEQLESARKFLDEKYSSLADEVEGPKILAGLLAERDHRKNLEHLKTKLDVTRAWTDHVSVCQEEISIGYLEALEKITKIIQEATR